MPEGARQLRDLPQVGAAAERPAGRRVREVHGRPRLGTGNATAGQKIGQWVDNSRTGSWNLVRTSDGFYRLQSVKNTSLYLTGATAGGQLTLQTAATDGSQDWELVQ
ncbi:hypothetical protein U5640_42680 [Streptomyces sp. SS7]|uniref:hypothetical protein n=1 Tax=Streptomyces sp. SS7 TaxID=3108485 RepID=UPI0030ED0337